METVRCTTPSFDGYRTFSPNLEDSRVACVCLANCYWKANNHFTNNSIIENGIDKLVIKSMEGQ